MTTRQDVGKDGGGKMRCCDDEKKIVTKNQISIYPWPSIILFDWVGNVRKQLLGLGGRAEDKKKSSGITKKILGFDKSDEEVSGK
ncbi:hypothetical protein RUM44_011525 [Polyplax serrata]|uniref:Uncharacterized protein n=1 Tax=Polyplax serrata TaxID=468196 RepID=A0ABR1AQA0_POLSC